MPKLYCGTSVKICLARIDWPKLHIMINQLLKESNHNVEIPNNTIFEMNI